MLIEGGTYTFNFTAARAACLFLNVTIATRTQLDRALQRGLETCKFGWIDEQIAVIPRLTADKNCGQSKTGVVTWSAPADKKFGVFCFNASAVPTAIIVLSIILLVLTAAGALWYYKLGKGNIFPFWSQGQQKDDIETEMWKQTGSELDLQSPHGAEEEEEDNEEETDRKYSGDVMMFMNPDVKTDLSE
ncbi:hypothetical protein PAMP_020161 [Pampus punctatissimus]